MSYAVALVLSIVIFQQHLSITKLEAQIRHSKALVKMMNTTDRMRQESFTDNARYYARWKDTYKKLKQQNYILVRKLRKSDNAAYRSYLTKLMGKVISD